MLMNRTRKCYLLSTRWYSTASQRPNTCGTKIPTAGIIGTRSISGVNQWDQELTTEIKLNIEKHWRNKLYDKLFDENSERQKFYVLSMFPYPSGQLHMGHVRVYSISDAVARFYRMTGKNVLHPMGWDAFGLPAENAALDRNVKPDKWTESNITNMKEQMEELGFSFDWDREVATCDPDYYKWTQYLFLKLYEAGLLYQQEAKVNWDPVDMTVLADEQVDNAGRSWRSGAKVEKKKLKQWFVKTTRFSDELYEGLNDPELRDWRDIIKLQKHWIGECNGTTIDFDIVSGNTTNRKISIWTDRVEHIDKAKFIAVVPGSIWDSVTAVKNPFTTDVLPVFVSGDIIYPENCDCHLGIPDVSDLDRNFAENVRIDCVDPIKDVRSREELSEYKEKICEEARRRGIGGHRTSSKLKDWLISRQRYWGTPIPMVHCSHCKEPVPIPEEELPVSLPKLNKIGKKGLSPLLEAKDWLSVKCPRCGHDATRETDTMDTFVDSSWYFLRYLDPDNSMIPFDPNKAKKYAPVDLYVGGKEHAVLHLYYARFFQHFLYSVGLVPHPEPFKRLLVQGMVKGKTFKTKKGQYVPNNEVTIKGKVAYHNDEQLITSWEKMSKSKYNGVDPVDMFKEFGTDTTRLILLADVAPTSHRNWSRDTFQGVLKWQHRLWLTMQKFIQIRNNLTGDFEVTEQFTQQDEYLFDSRNFYIKGATFNFLTSHQLSVGLSKMQGLTNSIRKSSDIVIGRSLQYERSLASQIILLAPFAPHFASELWSGFINVPHRLNNKGEILWDKPVLHQPWPRIDDHYCLDLNVQVDGEDVETIKLPKITLNMLKHGDAINKAMSNGNVVNRIGEDMIVKSSYKLVRDYEAVLRIVTVKQVKEENVDDVEQQTVEEMNK